MFQDRIGWSRPESGLGVEFGASAVKAVALVRERAEIRLLAADREPLPAGAVQDGAVRDVDVAAAALQRLVSRLGVRGRKASVGIGGRSYLVKHLTLAESDFTQEAAGLRKTVAAEAARHIPFHMEDILFDFETTYEHNGGRGHRLVFGAARREVVFAHGRAVVLAGLTPRRVEIEPFALRNALALEARLDTDNQPTQAPLAVVETGASHVAVHVFRPPFSSRIFPPSSAGDRDEDEFTAELASTVQTPGGGLAAAGEADPAGPEGAASGENRLGARIAASLAEALGEAGIRPPCPVRLSGGGAERNEILAALRPMASGEPTALDPIRLLGRAHGDPSLTFAAGLAFNRLEDPS